MWSSASAMASRLNATRARLREEHRGVHLTAPPLRQALLPPSIASHGASCLRTTSTSSTSSAASIAAPAWKALAQRCYHAAPRTTFRPPSSA